MKFDENLFSTYELMKLLTFTKDGEKIRETDIDGFPIKLSIKEIKDLVLTQLNGISVHDLMITLCEELRDESYMIPTDADNRYVVNLDDAIKIVRDVLKC